MAKKKKVRSTLEESAEKELLSRKITFIREHPLPILKKEQSIRVDFYLPDHQIFIELDGIQHFKFSRKFHRSKRNFLLQIDRDRRVDEYAVENGFRILHISFLSTLCVGILIDAILENTDEEIIFSDPELYETTRIKIF